MGAEICLGLIIAGITAYAVLGGADFGGGFWDLTAGGARRGGPIRGMVQRSMGPVWEANHVWLIFVLVVLWTAFPTAFGSIMSTLYIPLFGAAIGIIFRGTAFALRGQAATISEARILGGLFALSSVLVPFFLGTVIGAIGSGRVPLGNAAGDPITSWLNPTGVTIGVLAVITGAYLAAIYMTGDSVRIGVDRSLTEALRKRAIGAGIAAGVVALGALPILAADAPGLFDGFAPGSGMIAVVGSGLAGIATLALVFKRRYEWARVSAAAAVAAITVGWALAQYPYILPPELTFEQAAAAPASLNALLISVAVGSVVLVPSLWLLYRLTLRGDLSQSYEPLDQRFRPTGGKDKTP